MNKKTLYTAQYCKDNKIVVWCKREEARKLTKAWGREVDHTFITSNNPFEVMWCGIVSNYQPGYNKKYFIEKTDYGATKCINFKEVIFANLIGYKCPIKMFNGIVKIGTVYKIIDGNLNTKTNTCSWTDNAQLAYTNLPLELVQSWEPVYEELEEKIEIGGYEVKFSSKTDTNISGFSFSKEFWLSARTILDHSKARIKIGCSHQFDLDKDTVLKILKKLNSKK